MEALPSERTAVLIIRMWTEDDRGNVLRARVTRTLDITKPGEISTAASGKEDIEGIVSSWIDGYLEVSGVPTF